VRKSEEVRFDFADVVAPWGHGSSACQWKGIFFAGCDRGWRFGIGPVESGSDTHLTNTSLPWGRGGMMRFGRGSTVHWRSMMRSAVQAGQGDGPSDAARARGASAITVRALLAVMPILMVATFVLSWGCGLGRACQCIRLQSAIITASPMI
jgi:hypothetical protein